MKDLLGTIEKYKWIIIAIFLSFGLILNGVFIGKYWYKAKISERFVSVKGLSEREVKANLGVWRIAFSASSNDLTDAQNRINNNNNYIKKFLIQNGFKEDEIRNDRQNVSDKETERFGEDVANSKRFIISAAIILRSENVDLIDKVSSMTDKLIKGGVILQNDYMGPSFIFTKLNDIKTEMIKEATQNARVSAEQFAKDSGAKIGGIRNATQGYFSIESRDNIDIEGQRENNQIFKKVRVVTNIEYWIK
jgi:uncharacterized protein